MRLRFKKALAAFACFRDSIVYIAVLTAQTIWQFLSILTPSYTGRLRVMIAVAMVAICSSRL